MNSSITEAKATAQRLRARLSDLGVDVSHSQSLEAAAAALSGQDWNRHLAQLKDLQPHARPAQFLLSRPGDGGWDYLRAREQALLKSTPDGFTVWCFPDHLKIPVAPHPGSRNAHVFSTIEGLASCSAAQRKELLKDCRGKILLLMGPPSFGMPDEAFQNARGMFEALRKTQVGAAAARVTWMDIQRWTHSEKALGLLSDIKKAGWSSGFQSQIDSDLEFVARHFSLEAQAATLATQSQLLDEVRASLFEFRHPIWVLPWRPARSLG